MIKETESMLGVVLAGWEAGGLHSRWSVDLIPSTFVPSLVLCYVRDGHMAKYTRIGDLSGTILFSKAKLK